MPKTYSITMGTVIADEPASPKATTILREITGNRCYAWFAGGQLEEVVDDGFSLSYLPDMAAVDSAASALREAGVDVALRITEEIDDGKTLKNYFVLTIPAV